MQIGIYMKKIISKLRQLRNNERGSILIMWAILLPAAIGMTGLGVETGTWYLEKRKLQAAADSAAVTAAYQTSTSTRQTAASSSVSSVGLGNVSVTTNNPPQNGSYTSNANAVEVIISQPQNMLFSKLFLGSKPTISVRAVAVQQSTNTGNGGILSLATSGTGIEVKSGASLDASDCVVASNSSSSASINVDDSANFRSHSICTKGSYNTSGSGSFNTNNYSNSNSNNNDNYDKFNSSNSVSDPYASYSIPNYSGCDKTNYSLNSGSETLNPGVYCNGFSVGSGANVKLNPGVYVMDRGTFNVSGGANLTGDGVTIILTSSTGSNHATANICGGSHVNISAPTSGNNSGVAVYQDQNASDSSTNSFSGGSDMNITGAVHCSKGTLEFSGGSTQTPACTQVIGKTVSICGESHITSSCSNSGMSSISTASSGSSSTVKLVE